MLGRIIRTLFAAGLVAGGVAIVLPSVHPSHAEDSDLEGLDLKVSVALQEAVDVWLLDRDPVALPMLSELAKGGDKTAGVFLSLIERSQLSANPYFETLSRSEYMDLFRVPFGNGPFRKTWVDHLAEDGHAFARLVRSSWQPNPDLADLQELLDLGEPGVAMIGVRYVGLYGNSEQRATLLAERTDLQGMAAFLRSQEIDPAPGLQGMEALRSIVSQASGKEVDPGDEDARLLTPYLSIGHPFGTIYPDNKWYGDVVDWIDHAPEAGAIAGFCDRYCPMETQACGTSVLGLIGGYYGAIRFGSPLRGVVGQAEYAQSPKAHAMILHRLVSFMNEPGNELLATVPEIAEQSQCVAELVDHHRLKVEQEN